MFHCFSTEGCEVFIKQDGFLTIGLKVVNLNEITLAQSERNIASSVGKLSCLADEQLHNPAFAVGLLSKTGVLPQVANFRQQSPNCVKDPAYL